jgi:MurNAc alpha-1-phosphate uridylyltransferase
MEKTTGFEGAGDFFMEDDGRLTRRGTAARAPYAWMGVQIITKAAYANTPNEPFSNNLIWDRMIPKGRLYGLAHKGIGCHVGSPEGVKEAEEVLAKT